jgi:Outer membrane protein beta-barrel domain
MRIHRRLPFVIAAALALGAAPAAAQDEWEEPYDTKKWMIGLSLQGSLLDTRLGALRDESGVGFGVSLAYGFTDELAGLVRVDGASISAEGLNAEDPRDGVLLIDFGGRWMFGAAESPVRPYFIAAAGPVLAWQDDGTNKVDYYGEAFSVGGGVQLFLDADDGLAADFAVTRAWGRFTSRDVDGETFDLDDRPGFDNTRVQLGLAWYP